MKDAITRFEEKYVQDSMGCWIWQASVDKDGYGRFWFNGKTRRAHRFSYEYYKGAIRFTIDHLCRNPPCVNPDHLEDVRIRTNLLRGNGQAAKNARKLNCKKGHPFDKVVKTKGGRLERRCTICHNQYMKEWMANERAKRKS